METMKKEKYVIDGVRVLTNSTIEKMISDVGYKYNAIYQFYCGKALMGQMIDQNVGMLALTSCGGYSLAGFEGVSIHRDDRLADDVVEIEVEIHPPVVFHPKRVSDDEFSHIGYYVDGCKIGSAGELNNTSTK